MQVVSLHFVQCKWPRTEWWQRSRKNVPPTTCPEIYSSLSHHFCTLYVSYQNWMVVKAYFMNIVHVLRKCVSGPFLSPLVPPGRSPPVLAPGVWLKGPKHLHIAAYVGQYQHGLMQLQENKNLHCVKLIHMHLCIYNWSTCQWQCVCTSSALQRAKVENLPGWSSAWR